MTPLDIASPLGALFKLSELPNVLLTCSRSGGLKRTLDLKVWILSSCVDVFLRLSPDKQEYRPRAMFSLAADTAVNAAAHDMTPFILVAILLILICFRSFSVYQKCSQGLSFPPGPKPLPIIGNIFDMPPIRPWEGLRELGLKHGKLFFGSI